MAPKAPKKEAPPKKEAKPKKEKSPKKEKAPKKGKKGAPTTPAVPPPTSIGESLIGRVESKKFELQKLSKKSKLLIRGLSTTRGVITEHKSPTGTDVRKHRVYPLKDAVVKTGGSDLLMELVANKIQIKRTVKCGKYADAVEYLGYVHFTKLGGFESEANASSGYCLSTKERLQVWLKNTINYLQQQLNNQAKERKVTEKEAATASLSLGEKQMEVAAKAGNMGLLDWLVTNSRGSTVSSAASSNDSQEVVSLQTTLRNVLNKYGPALIDPKNPGFESTMLNEATREGDLQFVQILMTYGKPDVKAKGADGSSPLHVALESSKWELAEYLLNNGACPNAPCKCGMPPLVKLSKFSIPPVSLLKTFIKKGAALTAQDEDGNTPLMLLSKRGLLSLVSAVLETAKGDVNYRSTVSGRTALHEAASCVDENNRIQVIRTLIQNGANPIIPDLDEKTAIQILDNRRYIDDRNFVDEMYENQRDYFDHQMITLGHMTREEDNDDLSDVSDGIYIDLDSTRDDDDYQGEMIAA
eukprot:GHVR01030376.1.p1 GENE.GHVR01030376.1~~GHVR01030376.1.p1  ORF type:complete len:527 (+),score=117.44 GHVR01030376.1:80-1660(+)